jgi:hypothetical protein
MHKEAQNNLTIEGKHTWSSSHMQHGTDAKNCRNCILCSNHHRRQNI